MRDFLKPFRGQPKEPDINPEDKAKKERMERRGKDRTLGQEDIPDFFESWGMKTVDETEVPVWARERFARKIAQEKDTVYQGYGKGREVIYQGYGKGKTNENDYAMFLVQRDQVTKYSCWKDQSGEERVEDQPFFRWRARDKRVE